MADDQFSQQDIQDLNDIAGRLPDDDARKGKINTLLAKQAASAGGVSAGSTNPVLPKPKESIVPGLVRGSAATLPALGATAGGALASPGVVTSAAGVGLGATLGSRAEQLVNKYAFGDTPSLGRDLTTGAVAGVTEGVMSGVAGGLRLKVDPEYRIPGTPFRIGRNIPPDPLETAIEEGRAAKLGVRMPGGARPSEAEQIAKLKPWETPDPDVVATQEARARAQKTSLLGMRNSPGAFNPLSGASRNTSVTSRLASPGGSGLGSPLESGIVGSPLRATSAGDLASWKADDLWEGYATSKDTTMKQSIANELSRRGLVKTLPSQVKP